MFSRSPRILGLLLLVTLLASCMSRPPGAPGDGLDRVAEASYRAPTGAPEFCGGLAAAGALLDLPVALGTLAARPGDVGAVLRLADVLRELRPVLGGVRALAGRGRLEAALQALVADLAAEVAGTLPAARLAGLGDRMADVADLAAPACRFPVARDAGRVVTVSSFTGPIGPTALCAPDGARGGIPAGFVLDACIDAGAITLRNSLTIPVQVTGSGDLGQPVRLAGPDSAGLQLVRLVGGAEQVLVPGDVVRWPLGSGPAELIVGGIAPRTAPAIVTALERTLLRGAAPDAPADAYAGHVEVIRGVAEAVEVRNACAAAADLLRRLACDITASTRIGTLVADHLPYREGGESLPVLLDPQRWSAWAVAPSAEQRGLDGAVVRLAPTAVVEQPAAQPAADALAPAPALAGSAGRPAPAAPRAPVAAAPAPAPAAAVPAPAPAAPQGRPATAPGQSWQQAVDSIRDGWGQHRDRDRDDDDDDDNDDD